MFEMFEKLQQSTWGFYDEFDECNIEWSQREFPERWGKRSDV